LGDSKVLETKKWTYDGVNIASVTTDDETYDVYTVLPGSVGNVLERHTVNTASGGGTSNSRYYQYNHRGDVVMVTNASGGLIWAQDYTSHSSVNNISVLRGYVETMCGNFRVCRRVCRRV
jgi:uncharacterized protein RhaS with RHS repeats